MERTIAVLQELLTRLGYLVGPFKPRELDAPTRTAMQAFQRLHQLIATAETDDDTWEHMIAADEPGESVIIGQVTDGRAPVGNVTIVVQDRDLGEPLSWPRLGAAVTGDDGRFTVVYQVERVLPGDRMVAPRTAIADLVFTVAEAPVDFDGFQLYRLPNNARVSDVERAFGIQARRVVEVRITLRGVRGLAKGASDYARLLAALKNLTSANPLALESA